MEFTTDILSLFDKKWALLTAGNESSFNMMTISWGALGTIWGKPAATVYVRSSRCTHDFMEVNGLFTVSFYPEQYKPALGVLGSKSGRDMDKMKNSGLTPIKTGDAVSFAEADVTLVCRKLFMQTLDPAKLPADIAKALYEGQAAHDMYIGEILDIIRKG